MTREPLLIVAQDEVVKKLFVETEEKETRIKSIIRSLEKMRVELHKDHWETIKERLFELGLIEDTEKEERFWSDGKVISVERREEMNCCDNGSNKEEKGEEDE